jgi:rhodanese-related sulfurtransferase
MRSFRALSLETVVLLVAGFALALLANQFSPRGLSLKRDYFPRTMASPVVSRTTSTNQASSTIQTNEAAARIAARGLGVIGTDEVEKLFHDPQYEQELIVFIDARDDVHYQKGHIPGAYQFDRYYPEKYLPMVLPACLSASKIVVYCTGGHCEDSEFAAVTLIEAGIPTQKISIYLGGITDWVAKKKTVEEGDRKSGILKGNGGNGQ